MIKYSFHSPLMKKEFLKFYGREHAYFLHCRMQFYDKMVVFKDESIRHINLILKSYKFNKKINKLRENIRY